jgi:L-threonate 2-dehydrogenase
VKPIVAIVAQGAMGSGLAAVLTQQGVRVLTSLEGRSHESAQRARAAGMEAVAPGDLVTADLLLSIMPPVSALSFARNLAPLLGTAPRPPLFVDCNAISPATTAVIADVMQVEGVAFVDAGIIGLPPQQGMPGPRLYVSGPNALRLCALSDYGLDVRLMTGPIGAASALKLSYAGITKGLIAVASSMILGATRGSVADALHRELQESDPLLLEALSRRVRGMLPKAYRWVDEMRQIEDFVAADPAAAQIYRGASQLYDRLARDFSHDRQESGVLAEFFKAP